MVASGHIGTRKAATHDTAAVLIVMILTDHEGQEFVDPLFAHPGAICWNSLEVAQIEGKGWGNREPARKYNPIPIHIAQKKPYHIHPQVQMVEDLWGTQIPIWQRVRDKFQDMIADCFSLLFGRGGSFRNNFFVKGPPLRTPPKRPFSLGTMLTIFVPVLGWDTHKEKPWSKRICHCSCDRDGDHC